MTTVADVEKLDAECRRRGFDTDAMVGMANVLPKLKIYRFYRKTDHNKSPEYEIAGVWNPRKNSKIYDLEVI